MSRATLKAIQAAAGNAGESAVYADDVFSTYLYTGNGSTQTITNGIDLAGEGGLVWIKNRDAAVNHQLHDTERGASVGLNSNNSNAQYTDANAITSFNAAGFSMNNNYNSHNQSGVDFASWTFRKQPGFFDVVTYTGNSSTQTISHNLGAVPGMIIIKRYDGGLRDWAVYHRSLGNGSRLTLNGVGTPSAFAGWNYTTPTDTEFYLGNDSDVNNSAGTYVAYLFAHDDQRFGENEDESIISCGSYTASTNAFTDLGWEPQWIIYKDITNTGGWVLWDTMRGLPGIGTTPGQYFQANLSDAEASSTNNFKVGPTGFYSNNGGGRTYIYIAIRRPHKPASKFAATDLFAPTYAYQYDIEGNTSSSNGIHGYLGNPTDLYIQGYLSGVSLNAIVRSRMTNSNYLITSATSAETTGTFNFWDNNVGSGFESSNSVNNTLITYNFRRAPGFFDVVAYTGNGSSSRTISHNLGVAPEMMIFKCRTNTNGWVVYHASLGPNYGAILQSNSLPIYAGTFFSSTNPTSSVFTIGSASGTNQNTIPIISYHFATAPGISKVGSYTGTGSGLDVNCGFTSGARFVLVKRTDAGGDWYVWDSERGIVAGNDPYLLLNSAAAQVTSTDYIDPLSSGFTITSSAPAALNASGGTYIFLAIA